jgi:inner membrane protein
MEPFLWLAVIGVVCILAEIFVLGLTTFWLLFIGIGAVVAGALSYALGLEWTWSLTLFAVCVAITALTLMKPLRNWQNKPSLMPGNDIIGMKVTLMEDIQSGAQGKDACRATVRHKARRRS